MDAKFLLNDRLAKSEARVPKLEKQLEQARAEISDLRTTLRVLAELEGQDSVPSSNGTTVTVGVRQSEILSVLRVGPHNAQSPSELYDGFALIASDNVNLDTFRTTVWRMKDKGFRDAAGVHWHISARDGKYWKFRADPPLDENEPSDDNVADGSEAGED